MSNKKENIIKEKEKNSLSKKNLVIFAVLAILIMGIFIYYNQVIHKVNNNVPQRVVHNYTPLIDNWNRQVQNMTEKKEFLLNRDSNENMITQLNEFMKTFYIPDISDQALYNTYLEENKIGKLISFDTSMDKDKIKETLKKASRESAMSDIVKKVLMMNSLEIWSKRN